MNFVALASSPAAPAARIQSIGRAAALLDAMRGGGWVRLRDLARAAGLHKTTAFNLAMALVDVGLVEHDGERGAYRLGPRLAEFGRAVENRLSANG
jgi:IclR family acetate operon transcriptional repressor